MVTEKDIQIKFKDIIINDDIIIRETVLKQQKDKVLSKSRLFINVNDFYKMFKDTFPDSVKMQKANKKNKWGYEKYINEWKKQGILD